ncbi:MAG: thioredoxin family protein [Verrucomicrobiota bacterium]
MKKTLLCLLGCWMAVQLQAADLTWLTSVPDAQTRAKKESKLVLLDFTGSDWCSWCKKLDAEVFSQQQFADYAKKNLVLVEVDFPAQKKLDAALAKANDALKVKYKIAGFPTLIALKPDGAVVWNQVGYLEGGPKAVIAKLDEAKKK